MGSATDGLTPWDYAAALGYPPGSYAVPGAGYSGTGYSGSVTDGPRIAIAQLQPAGPATPATGWWNTPPVVAQPQAPPVEEKPPPVEEKPPEEKPPPPVTPIDPGGPIDQPSSLGNALGGALLNPPKFFVGGLNEYGKKKSAGSLQTTQT